MLLKRVSDSNTLKQNTKSEYPSESKTPIPLVLQVSGMQKHTTENHWQLLR